MPIRLTEQRIKQIAQRLGVLCDSRRISRAWDLWKSGSVWYHDTDAISRIYRVKSQRMDRWYEVRVNHDTYPTCDCADWRDFNGRFPASVPVCTHRCKHGLAVMMLEAYQKKRGMGIPPARYNHAIAGGKHAPASNYANWREHAQAIAHRRKSLR